MYFSWQAVQAKPNRSEFFQTMREGKKLKVIPTDLAAEGAVLKSLMVERETACKHLLL